MVTDDPVARAEQKLAEIGEKIDQDVFLVGGLAVRKYVPSRRSFDIDLVCPAEVAAQILQKAFPQHDYDIVDQNDDSLRPAFHARSKSEKAGASAYLFGPKVEERGQYVTHMLDVLRDDRHVAKPYTHKTVNVPHIYLPSPEALALVKLLAVASNERNESKRSNDMSDVANLASVRNFSCEQLLTLMLRHAPSLPSELSKVPPDIGAILHQTPFFRLGAMFHSSIEPRPSVAIAVMLHPNKGVLLTQRIDGSWQFPASMMKPGDDPGALAVHTVKEEAGITCEDTGKIGVRLHPDTRSVCHYHACTYRSGRVRNGDPKENKSVSWVSSSQALRLLGSSLFEPVAALLLRHAASSDHAADFAGGKA